MSRLTISPTKDYFLRDGKPFFWMGDTLWSAFCRTSMNEWKQILHRRKQQGFNVIQIMVLPPWDRSRPDDGPFPFLTGTDGSPDFNRPNPEYFEEARKKLEYASKLGFIPALAPVWVHEVENTWGERTAPGTAMTKAQIEHYLDYIIPLFKPYAPVYLCSGDCRYESRQEIDLYAYILKKVHELDPEALTTLHPAPCEIPEELLLDKNLDFYLFQSGHEADQSNCRKMSELYSARRNKKPVVNGEPCYEASGHGNAHGRFTERDVRRSVWTSLFSGAKAGVTYGAHGLWSMHRQESSFPSEQFSSLPPHWESALFLRGADDMGWISYLYNEYEMWLANPVDLLCEKNEEIYVSAYADKSKVFIYAAYPNYLLLKGDFSGFQATAFALETRRVLNVTISEDDKGSRIEYPGDNYDILYVLERRN